MQSFTENQSKGQKGEPRAMLKRDERISSRRARHIIKYVLNFGGKGESVINSQTYTSNEKHT